MIRSRLSLLLAEKAHREGRKLPYRLVSRETGLSQGVLVRLNSEKIDRVDADSLNTLCGYFSTPGRVVGVGDILEYLPEEGATT